MSLLSSFVVDIAMETKNQYVMHFRGAIYSRSLLLGNGGSRGRLVCPFSSLSSLKVTDLGALVDDDDLEPGFDLSSSDMAVIVPCEALWASLLFAACMARQMLLSECVALLRHGRWFATVGVHLVSVDELGSNSGKGDFDRLSRRLGGATSAV